MKLTLLIIIFSIGTIFLFFKEEKKDDPVLQVENEKTVEVESFKKEKFSRKVKLRGFTNASRVVTIKAQVDGIISSKQFNKGNFYKAGKQLIVLDPEDKVARLKEMEALLNQRKKEFEVSESLFKKGFRSEVKLSESRTNFENALALYERSQVELNNTKVLMPFDSSVEESFVELGDYVKKGDPIAKIVDLNPIFIITSANEKEITSIKIDQSAKVKIGEKTIIGKVNYISKTSDPNTRNFKIQVIIENDNKDILSGLSSEIEIDSQKVDAYFLPSSLITLNNQGKIGIKIIKNQQVIFVPIDIISDKGNGYWINLKKSNIEDPISVIIQGQDYTVDGEKVKVIKRND
ncbi:MAG: efflux RND transporter periplasmic adaptor subunit [Pseudomonadota bacterium]|nr:efflux RND transporter periplasmic adaptor subunit [Pseudomonadota bacterium]